MRSSHRHQLFVALLAVGLALLLKGAAQPADDWLPPNGPARVYAERALRTQRFTDEQLTFLAGGGECGSAALVGFERENRSALSDAWYAASQLMADAALARLGQERHQCMLVKTIAFLDRVARPTPDGGYYPRADLDGQNPTTRDTYADDNGLIGLAFLEARVASDDPAWRAALLERAERAARFLTDGGLWDDTFGGGFWWNTRRGEMSEGKPAQTTAVAALLFARLYEATGEPGYAGWARACLAWLDGRLFDPASGLYRYNLRYWDMPGQTGEYVDPRLFGYDQGIMIEVHLAFERSIEPDVGHLARAHALAERLQTAFWDPERGGYRLEADVPQVYAAYSAWLTPSLLALYDVDPDPRWLAWARANLDAVEAGLLDPAEGGYFQLERRCDDPETPGCGQGDGWVHDPTKLLFSQAWVQRAQALLAAALAADRAPAAMRAE